MKNAFHPFFLPFSRKQGKISAMRKIPVTIKITVIEAAILFFAMQAAVLAQGQALPAGLDKDTEVYYQKMVLFKDSGETVLVFSGNVEVIRQGMTLSGDYVIVWAKEKSPAEEVAQDKTSFEITYLYAEGGVHFAQGASSIICDKLCLNVQEERGVFYSAEYRTKDAEKNLPIVIMADKIIQADRQTFEAYNAYFSTCSFKEPHYAFWSYYIKYSENQNNLVLLHTIMQVEKIPLLYVPLVVVGVNDELLLKHFSFADSNRFGTKVETEWGFPLAFIDKNADGGKEQADAPAEEPDVNKEDERPGRNKKFGDLLFEYDYMTKRGIGLGLDAKYKYGKTEGSLDTYYILDKGPDPEVPFETRFLPLEDSERTRIKNHLRYSFTEKLRIDTEVSYVSDRNFLYEFMEDEYKNGKPQETYAYLRYANNNTAATVLERARLNSFQSQMEYLPQASFYTYAVPVVKNLYFTNRSEIGNMRKSYDELTEKPFERILRFDTLNELSYPFSLLNLHFFPYTADRYTYYDMTPSGGEDTDRNISSAGIRMFTQFHRVFDVHNDMLGMNGLRHLFEIDLRYNRNFSSDLTAAGIPRFDGTDELNEFEEVAIDLRNAFETKKKKGGSYVKFLEFNLGVEYYPEPQRDTMAADSQNYLYPMNWMLVLPSADKTYQERSFSDVQGFLQLSPLDYVGISSLARYNTYDSRFDAVYTSMVLRPHSRFSVSLTDTFIADYSHSLMSTLNCSFSDKWTASFSEQYEFETDMLISRRVALHRDLHDFLLDIYFDLDEAKEEQTFWVTFSAKGFKSGLTSFREPGQ